MNKERPKLGIVQSRGLGDIVIALPIAKHWHDAGWDVFWPIDANFLSSFQSVAPYVEFIPFNFTKTFEGFVMDPVKLLKAKGCQKILTLYSYLSSGCISDPVLANSLKFDEYKYAVSNVPFREKWELDIRRNSERETQLMEHLVSQPDYVVTHLTGSDFKCAYVPDAAHAKLPVVNIEAQSESIFDWLKVIENARHLYMVDSCFSNLVEQLNFTTPKTLYLRSEVRFTPVMRNGWNFAKATPRK